MSRVPALRLLIPFIAGIILALEVTGGLPVWIPCALAAVAVATLVLLRFTTRTPMARLRVRAHFVWPIALLALAAGALDATLQRPAVITPETLDDRLITARIDHLSTTQASMDLRLKVLSCHDSTGAATPLPPLQVRVTTRGCDYALRAGDIVNFKSRLRPVKNAGNPDELDFATMLARQGILYEQHLTLNRFHKTDYRPTWLNRCDNTRLWLERKVLGTRLSPPAQGFVIAILLGNSDFIDTDTRNTFSQAGVAHVLALSGLHVAIVMSIIWFFLFPLDYLRARRLRLALTIVILAGYAMLTGASPSVVRAAIMAATAMAAFVLQRRAVPLNALSVAALLIVIATPAAVFSAGFQMSFFTVGALVACGNRLRAHAPSHPVLKFLYYLVTTSLAVLAATLMLTAYYFHHISWGAVMANVLVVPLFPVLLTACALFLFLAACNTQWDWLNAAIDRAYDALEAWSSLVARWQPQGGMVWVDTVAVWCYYGLLLAVAAWWFTRNRRWPVVAAAIAVAWAGQGVYRSLSTPRVGYVVFNEYDTTPVLYFERGRGYLWMPLDTAKRDIDMFTRRHASFLAHHKVEQVELVPDSGLLTLDHATFNGSAAWLDGTSVMQVGPGKWKRSRRNGNSRVNMMLITSRFHGTVDDLRRLYDLDSVAFSGNIFVDTRLELAAQCRTAHIPFRDLGNEGAIVHFIP